MDEKALFALASAALNDVVALAALVDAVKDAPPHLVQRLLGQLLLEREELSRMRRRLHREMHDSPDCRTLTASVALPSSREREATGYNHAAMATGRLHERLLLGLLGKLEHGHWYAVRMAIELVHPPISYTDELRASLEVVPLDGSPPLTDG